MVKQIRRVSKPLVLLLFVIILVVGLLIVDDYGNSMDDRIETNTTLITSYYALKTLFPSLIEDIPVQNLETYVDRDYGVAIMSPTMIPAFFLFQRSGTPFEFNSATLEKQYYFRHIYVFLICFLSYICLYFIIKKWSNSRYFAVLGVLFMVLSPRIFADSFYNSKDAIALSAVIFFIFFFQRFFEKQTYGSALLMSLSAALMVNTRMPTALLLVMAFLYYGSVLILQKQLTPKKILLILFVLFTAALFFYIVTPSIWKDPISYFQYAFSNTIAFQRWNGNVLYRGKTYSPGSNPLPWHYIFVMYGITVPILITVLALAGLGFLVYRLVTVKRAFYCSPSGLVLVAAVFSVATMLAVAIIRPNIYNAWRQLFYVYAGIVLLSVFGAQQLIQCSKNWFVKAAVVVGIIAQLTLTAGWMVLHHPYEYIYYNPLAGRNVPEMYELDYWNVSFSRTASILVSQSHSSHIYFAIIQPFSAHNYDLYQRIPKIDRNRVTPMNDELLIYADTEIYLTVNPTYTRVYNSPEFDAFLENREPIYQLIAGRYSIQDAYLITKEEYTYLVQLAKKL